MAQKKTSRHFASKDRTVEKKETKKGGTRTTGVSKTSERGLPSPEANQQSS